MLDGVNFYFTVALVFYIVATSFYTEQKNCQVKFSSKLQSGRLIKRYKRFLADVELNDSTITIHCPNTGAMTGCATPGDQVWFSTSDNPKRKYPNTWELNHNHQGHWIGINTARANHIVKDALEQNQISALNNYSTIRSEVKYGDENSRIDLLLHNDDKPDCYIEVKSVTLLGEEGQGYFPDAVSTRGQKHIRELAAMAAKGNRAVLLFLVQHSGIEKVSPAHHIDEQYGQLLIEAIKQGIEVLCYRTKLSPEAVTIEKQIPFNP